MSKNYKSSTAISTLTAKEAKKLIKTNDWKLYLPDEYTSLSSDGALALANFSGESLSLNGLKELSDSAAQSLTKFKGSLSLGGLKQLSDSAAQSLAKIKGGCYLSLYGLKELSDPAAQSLSKFKGDFLELHGLTTLSAQAAKSLANFKGDLGIGKLRYFSLQVANAFRFFKGGLTFSGATSISEDMAKALAKCSSSSLTFEDLNKLSPKAASALSQYKETLSFPDISSLSASAAKSISNYSGPMLSFVGDEYFLRNLTQEAARHLAQCTSPLGLAFDKIGHDEIFKTHPSYAEYRDTLITADSLETYVEEGGLENEEFNPYGWTMMDEEAAAILAKHKGALYLETIIAITPAVAKALTKCEGLHILGLETLSIETAKILAKGKTDSLSLPGLEQITPDLAEVLSIFKGDNLSLGIKTLDAESAKHLGNSKAKRLGLGIKTLDAESAKHLGNSKAQELELEELQSLTIAAASKLSQFKGHHLTLNWRDTDISDRAFKALAYYRGSLFFSCNDTSLPFSPLVIKYLKRKINNGEVFLPNNVSPSMAKALVEHVNAELDFDVADLSLGAIKHFAEYEGKINYQFNLTGHNPVGGIKANVWKALSKDTGEISLFMEAIPPSVAKVLANKKGSLELHIDNLSPTSAKELAKHTGKLTLNSDFDNFIILSAAKQLAKHQGELELNIPKPNKSILDALKKHPSVSFNLY